MTDKFEVIAADITNNCNLRCTFCFNDFTGAKNQFIAETKGLLHHQPDDEDHGRYP